MGREQVEEVFPLCLFNKIINKYGVSSDNCPIELVPSILNQVFSHNWSYEIKTLSYDKDKPIITISLKLAGITRDGVGVAATPHKAMLIAITSAFMTLLTTTFDPKGDSAITETHEIPPGEIEGEIEPRKVIPVRSISIPEDIKKNDDTKIEEQYNAVDKLIASFQKYFQIDSELATRLYGVWNKHSIPDGVVLFKYIRCWDPTIPKASYMKKEDIESFITWMDTKDSPFSQEECDD